MLESTLAKIGYSNITEMADNIDYDDIIWLRSTEAGGREISASPKGETNIIYADGLPVIQADDNSGYDISLQLLAAVDDVEEDWFGSKKKLSDGSMLETGGTSESPRFALLAAKELYASPKKYAIDIYFYCSASNRPSKKSKTSEGKFDPEFPEYSIAAAPRPDNKFVCHTIYADTLPTSITVPTLTVAQTSESE